MASIALLFVAMLLLGSSSSSSLADVTSLLTCSASDDRVTSSEERIKNFLDCLSEQGHNEELLTELRRSFEGQTPSTSNSSPGALSFCSGMTDLQCRTLTVVLESLLNEPPSPGDQPPLLRRRRRRRRSAVDPSSIEGRVNRSSPDSSFEMAAAQEGRGGHHSRDSAKTPELGEDEEMAKEKKKKRVRRLTPPGLPFKLPDKLTPEMQAVLESYLTWRGNNGYGRITGRWG